VSRAESPDSFIGWASRFGRWAENTLLSVLLLGTILLAVTQILLRDLGLGTLLWGDEAIRLMVLWIAMVGGVAAAREDRHIAIDVLSRFLSEKGRAATAILVDVFTIAVCLALAWYGWVMIRFALEDGDTVLLGLPAWFFQGIIPAAFLCIAWRYFVWLLRNISKLFSGWSD
jgi:TRAP-type C4-dicarboxylate transport system permease small subunit